MKIRRVIQVTISVAIASFITGCSGNKKEQVENHKGHDKMDSAKVEKSITMEVTIFENVDASVKKQINGFLTGYFVLNQSLIEDNQDNAKAAAQKLSEVISKFDMSKLQGEQMAFYHTQLAKLHQSLKGISASADIEETRLELATLSNAMYSLVKAYHPQEAELYYQFCPMARNNEGANWLSLTKEIVNPYMGQRMLKCGSTEETLN